MPIIFQNGIRQSLTTSSILENNYPLAKMSLQHHKDLPRAVHIWYTGISLENERRRRRILRRFLP